MYIYISLYIYIYIIIYIYIYRRKKKNNNFTILFLYHIFFGIEVCLLPFLFLTVIELPVLTGNIHHGHRSWNQRSCQTEEGSWHHSELFLYLERDLSPATIGISWKYPWHGIAMVSYGIVDTSISLIWWEQLIQHLCQWTDWYSPPVGKYLTININILHQ